MPGSVRFWVGVIPRLSLLAMWPVIQWLTRR